MSFFKQVKDFVFSKSFLVNIALLVMVYLVIAIGTIYYLNHKTHHGEKIEVPNYIGKNINAVMNSEHNKIFTFEVVDSIYDPSKATGTILYQSPSPSKQSDVYVKEGRTIRFRVSKKTMLVEVPLMVDRSERYAESVLSNMNLKASISYTPSQEANGAVLAQSYRGVNMKDNQKVPAGSTIHLTVGKGYDEATIPVPDFTCLTISDVNARLMNYSGLTINSNFVNCTTKADSLRAKVTNQSPAVDPTQMIPANSTITLTFDGRGCN